MTFTRTTLTLVCLTFAAGSLAQKPAAKHPLAKPAASVIDPALKAALAAAPKASQWPNANYARLLDLQTVEVKPDGTVVQDCRETLKIFNERGRQMAEVSLPYNSSYQTINVTRARTIRKDGTIQDVKPDDIRSSSSFSEYSLYDDSMSVSFSMPGVADDCVIDYSWRMVTKPLIMPGHFWDYWAFSGPEPVSLSKYTLKLPAAKRFRWKVYNDDTLQPTESASPDGKTKSYVWQKRDLKPIETEPAMPEQSEVRVWMQVSSIGAWDDLAGWFSKLAKPQATANDAIKAQVAKLTAGKTTDTEKATAIYDFVANSVRYVGLEFGLSAFKPHAASQVYSNLYGDCKDKATLLVTMLGLAGIEASPVLLSSEDKSALDAQLPSLNAFNHCIALAEVDGKEVWLDATAETCSFGDVPESDRGADALVVAEGASRFERIPRYEPAANGFDAVTKVDLQPDGTAAVNTETKMRGASAQQWRYYVRNITPEQRKQMVQAMAQSFSTGVQVKEYKLPDGTDKAGPYVMQLAMMAPSRAKKTRNLLIVPVANTVSTSDRSNPFVKEQREWPIVVEEASQQRGETTVTVPAGYELEDVPADLKLTSKLFDYTRQIIVSPDGRTIHITVVSSSKPGRVPPSDYAAVRAHYDQMLAAMDDPIVLRRADSTPAPMIRPPADRRAPPADDPPAKRTGPPSRGGIKFP